MEERCQLLVYSSDDLISGWQVQQGQTTETGKVAACYMQMTEPSFQTITLACPNRHGASDEVGDKTEERKKKKKMKGVTENGMWREGWLSLASHERKVWLCVPNVVFKRFFWGGFVLI